MDKEQDGFLNLNRRLLTLLKLIHVSNRTLRNLDFCDFLRAIPQSGILVQKYILMSALKRISTVFCL